MPKEVKFRIQPQEYEKEEIWKQHVSRILKTPSHTIQKIIPIKKSLDARKGKIAYEIKGIAYFNGESIPITRIQLPQFPDVKNAPEVVIIGTGPAGLFCALELLLHGIKPILIERGKNVRDRIFDIRDINVRGIVNPNSNYSFGEGGAGTYSDGKLYTRSTKRGDIREVYERLVGFGASEEILIESHPHIGTNKLPQIVSAMRDCIIHHGGEVLFETKLLGFQWEGNLTIQPATIKGVYVQKITKPGEPSQNPYFISANQVVLATGHSARDVFMYLWKNQIQIHSKPIAVGVRVEHPQDWLDRVQYKRINRENLPPASYSIVCQIGGRGIYSFCMCPGGVIAPCATEPDGIVTNGWSSSGRGRHTANSGIVVELREEDQGILSKEISKILHEEPELSATMKFSEGHPLWFMEFQRILENQAWHLAGKTQKAPAQRITDFLIGKASQNLPKTSYPPGITSTDLNLLFPQFIKQRLKQAFQRYNQVLKGFIQEEGILHAPETRTSSPIRIPRETNTLMHPQLEGLYPCGEGAGYAGGIVSAALDGIRVARAILKTKKIKIKES